MFQGIFLGGGGLNISQMIFIKIKKTNVPRKIFILKYLKNKGLGYLGYKESFFEYYEW